MPGFALVRQELDAWTPERGAEVTDVPADTIVRLANAYATTHPAAILMGGGSNHWYHGDLTGRAFALLAALTGNIGRSGGGFSVYVGQYKVRVDTSPWWSPGGQKAKVCPSIYFVRGRTDTMHPDVPYPANGWHGLVCTFANMFVQSMDVEPAPPDARRAGPHRRGRAPDDRDRALGGRRRCRRPPGTRRPT